MGPPDALMANVIAFIGGSSLVFLILMLLENRGKLRWIKKFGNPQIGGRASPDGWKPPKPRKQEPEK